MDKKLFLLTIVLSVLLAIYGTAGSSIMVSNQAGGVHNASLALQATQEPPIPLPTIVIPTIVVNPPPNSGGSSFPLLAIAVALLVALVGAIVLIALVAVLRR